MDQLFSITPLKVNQLITKIETGELGCLNYKDLLFGKILK